MPLEKWVCWSKKIVNKCFGVFLFVLLYLWKGISPYFLGSRCRFQPSCSEYAVKMIKERGLFFGGILALKRLGRCHPLGGGGD